MDISFVSQFQILLNKINQYSASVCILKTVTIGRGDLNTTCVILEFTSVEAGQKEIRRQVINARGEILKHSKSEVILKNRAKTEVDKFMLRFDLQDIIKEEYSYRKLEFTVQTQAVDKKFDIVTFFQLKVASKIRAYDQGQRESRVKSAFDMT